MRCATAHLSTGGSRRAILLVALDTAVLSTTIATLVRRFQSIRQPGETMRLARPLNMIALVAVLVGHGILLVALLVGVHAAFSQSSTAVEPIQPEEVAPGVFVFPSHNATEEVVDGNSTFIIGSKAVLVVDAPSMRLTRQHLAWLRRRTSLPVRYLVNTHFHLDHVSGNQILADAFPGLSILASEYTKRIGDRRLPALIAAAGRPGGTDSTIERAKRLVATGRDEEGKELAPFEAERIRRAVAYLTRELPDRKLRRYVGPTEIVGSERRIDLGGRTVCVRNYPGHTLGDIVAIVEDAGVLITGDLVVSPVPYGTGNTVFRQWSASLRALEALPRINTIVPGHGGVMRSWDYVRLEREAIDSLTAQVNAAVREGLTFEETKARVNMSRFRDLFAGSDPDRRLAFDNYFLGIRRAFDEASGLVD